MHAHLIVKRRYTYEPINTCEIVHTITAENTMTNKRSESNDPKQTIL